MISCIVDGSVFDEFKALYGETVVTGELVSLRVLFISEGSSPNISSNIERIYAN